MNNIKRLRMHKGLGVNELGRLCNLSPSYISALESGAKTNPSVAALEKLAKALEVPTDQLLKETPILDAIEDNISLVQLSEKTGLPQDYLVNLDNMIPEEKDYENVKKIENIIGDKLYFKEPPAYEGYTSTPQEDFNEFRTPESAMQFILKQPAIMGFGGFNINKMSEDEILEFANELLNQLKLLSYKYK